MTRTLSRSLWSIAILLATLACGPGVEEGPLPVSPDTESDSPTEDSDTPTNDTDPVFCPGEFQDSCSNLTDWDSPKLLVETGDLNNIGEFLDFTSEAILARDIQDEPDPILVMMYQEDPDISLTTTYATLPPQAPRPTTGLSVVSSDANMLNLGYRHLVAISNSKEIALYGANYDSDILYSEMVPIPNSVLPGGMEIRGMTYLGAFNPDIPTLDRVCLFGDGLVCFDGQQWVPEIAAGAGEKINDLTALLQPGIANLLTVGDHGRIWVKTDSSWELLPVVTETNLTAVSARGTKFTAAGEGGVFVEGTLAAQLVCEIAAANPVSVDYRSVTLVNHFMGIGTDGLLFLGYLDPSLNGWLCYTGDTYNGPLRARYVGENYFIMNATQLFGQEAGEAIIIE